MCEPAHQQEGPELAAGVRVDGDQHERDEHAAEHQRVPQQAHASRQPASARTVTGILSSSSSR